ncbi:MAG: hypothetical protein HGA62_04655 [Chlorobiaceae bacterium]|nr:hypothetical protein [Chlorobiaceae bacterium]NTV60886.1 hypothetical protein [Chlorobiaceae bacterium]
MKPSKHVTSIFLCAFILLTTNNAVHASPNILQKDVQIINVKLCADIKASLVLTRGAYGQVTVFGTVTNAGKGSYNIPSVAEVIMNLAYAPKFSYTMSGVSAILASKPFTALKAGESFKINASYQIPDFGGWNPAGAAPNARRLFTLRVIKQDGSPYTSGEECDPGNNTAAFELSYFDLKH